MLSDNAFLHVPFSNIQAKNSSVHNFYFTFLFFLGTVISLLDLTIKNKEIYIIKKLRKAVLMLAIAGVTSAVYTGERTCISNTVCSEGTCKAINLCYTMPDIVINF